MKYRIICTALACVLGASNASAISLDLVGSFARNNPFGLAFDGTHIWWSDSGRTIHQMTTAGVDTGVTFTGPVVSELAWNGSQLVQASGKTVYFFDKGTGANQTTQTITAPGISGPGLIDGLDWDHGELWYSPDVNNVYRLDSALANNVGASPFLGGGGGFSGVERIQGASKDFVVVVNDAKSPRELCVHELDATLIGCQQFANSRYEGLAFDGRFVWAADFFGDRIDKYDILGDDGGSIINPVPLPATLPLMVLALGALGYGARRRKS